MPVVDENRATLDGAAAEFKGQSNLGRTPKMNDNVANGSDTWNRNKNVKIVIKKSFAY